VSGKPKKEAADKTDCIDYKKLRRSVIAAAEKIKD